MRLLITTQVFPPEIHPTAIMAHELAQGLGARGWEVDVVAGLPHHPTGTVARSYGRFPAQVEERHGYRVMRSWHLTSSNRNIGARGLVMLNQALSSAMASALSHRPDVVLSFGGPPLLGPILSGLLAAVWRVPMVTLIHDLYPDVAIESGALRNSLLIESAYLAESLQYHLSSRVVVLSESFKSEVVAKGMPAGQIDVVPVWLDPAEIVPRSRENAWRAEQGIAPEIFVVLFAGTIGIISGAEYLEQVARGLPDDIVIVLVGGGASWRRIASAVEIGRAPRNIIALPYQPRSRLSEVQATSDLSLLTLAKGKGRTSVPSKLQGYMAAGRPVLAAVDSDSETARTIHSFGFGRVVPPEDERQLTQSILELQGKPATLNEWGRSARRGFELEHDRERRIGDFDSILRAEIIRRRV